MVLIPQASYNLWYNPPQILWYLYHTALSLGKNIPQNIPHCGIYTTQKGVDTMKKCTIDSCNSQHYAKGLCKKHYAQHLRGSLIDKSRSTEDIIADIRSYESYINTCAKSDKQTISELFTLIQELINR